MAPIITRMNHRDPGQSRYQWLAIVAPAAILLAAAWGAAAYSDAVDEPFVCDTTVYEGCPSRWEAEWATPTPTD